MKLIDNVLFIEFSEMVESGISENTLISAKKRKSPAWQFIDDPRDKRKVLIGYEQLKPEYKQKLNARFGNPYEYMAKAPIRELVKWDDKAEEFFLAYRYDGDKTLPTEHVKKYTLAASWLNMFKAVTEDKKALKKLLNLTIEQFYDHAIEIIITEKIDLPSSYRRLLATRKQYDVESYSTLIDWRFGNKLAAKINDEVSESLLLKIIKNGNQFDDVILAQQYNIWAKANNYKQIDAATVGVWRRKRGWEVTMEREGNAAFKGKFIRQVKGYRPTFPLCMVENDDNHLDLTFIDPENPEASPRYIAIVVTDSYNDYVLGYAYALAGTLKERQSIALVKAAYANAMYHIRSLTGGWHLPQEIKADNWAIKTLGPWYKSLGNFLQTPVGSKNRGYIENFFGSPHWKRCLKIEANNYTGNNITAKNRGVNVDLLARNKKNLPLIGKEAHQQIENFFYRLRHVPQSNGISKHDQWMQAWNELPAEKKRPISDEQYLLKFGIEHNHQGEGLRISNRGVQPQILNPLTGQSIKYKYDLVTYRMEDVNKRVSVIYDPFDMSRVLVTDHQSFRMMAQDSRLASRTIADADTDSRIFLRAIWNEKTEQVETVSQLSERRNQILDAAAIDADSVLKAGVMRKEIKQAAEQRVLAQVISNGSDHHNDEYFNQM